MAYQHGVYVQEVASRVVATASVDAGLPVVIGTAIKPFSEPQLVVTYDDAVAACGGYIGVNVNGVHDFTLCEFIKTFFVNANLSKAVFINVFDHSKHLVDGIADEATPESITLAAGEGVLNQPNAVISAVKVSSVEAVEGTDYTVSYGVDGKPKITRISTSSVIASDTETISVTYKKAESITLAEGKGVVSRANAVISSVMVSGSDKVCVEGTDYSVEYGVDGKPVINRISTSTKITTDTAILSVIYKVADFSLVKASDILAGIQKVADIYPQTLLVPGQLVCPRYSCFTSVAVALKNAANSVGGVYRCIALCDIPTANDSLSTTSTPETVTGVTAYADVPNGKQVVSPDVVLCWPMCKLGAEKYHGSSVYAATACQTDNANGGIPYYSPSNHSGNIGGACLKDGTAIWLKAPQANELNAAGVVTFLSTSSGWNVWGSRLSAYPGSTDAKDTMVPVRRMMNWVGNTLINTFFQKVDAPLNKRQIESIVDSANVWLNGLVGGAYLIAGQVEFRDQDNTSLSLSDGIANFRVTLCPPSPNRAIIFTLEYNALAYSALFE